MKLKTNLLKQITKQAVCGAGFNRLVPLTGMIGIKCVDGKLKLQTTDLENDFCISMQVDTKEEFNVAVDGEKFSKLIEKLNYEMTEIVVNEEALIIKADGTYKLPLITDEDGLVVFEDIQEGEFKLEGEIKLSDVLCVQKVNKSSLAKTLEIPQYMGYYVDKDMVISTNTMILTFNNVNLLGIPNCLISSKLLDLVALNTREDIKWYLMGNELLFKTSDIIIKGSLMDEAEAYRVDNVKELLNTQYKSSCKLKKDLIIDVLGRLSLFIEPYDRNAIKFNFTRTGLEMSSNQNTGVEVIKYVEFKDFEHYECMVDVLLLKELLEGNPDETIELFFGESNSLKIKNDNITQFITLIVEAE